MEIRDVIHGTVQIDPPELPILDSSYFQRLRHIKQLGFSEYSYPSASHNRYMHSIGAMHTATLAFSAIFGKNKTTRPGVRLELEKRIPPAYQRFLAVTRLAALLHDIGHGPLSHTTESAMPMLNELKVPGHSGERQATHEDYTLKIILDSQLTQHLENAGRPHGFGPKQIASLIQPTPESESDPFFQEIIDGERITFHPILSQLISSELDADRMDYLRRDSFHAGVSYGNFDFDWMVSSLTSHIQDKKCHLALQHRALFTFEDFLISRYHMFMMVYFHYKGVIYDEMLGHYFAEDDCPYKLSADIDNYCETNDAQLYAHLAKSKNQWARRITEKTPYRVLVEFHSGIPATDTASQEQERLFSQILDDLAKSKIHVIQTKSAGQISKYFKKQGLPIFIRYDNLYNAPTYIPLEKCTDLFQRYEEKRLIRRIYVSPEDYQRCRNHGRGKPFRFESGSAPDLQPQ